MPCSWNSAHSSDGEQITTCTVGMQAQENHTMFYPLSFVPLPATPVLRFDPPMCSGISQGESILEGGATSSFSQHLAENLQSKTA